MTLGEMGDTDTRSITDVKMTRRAIPKGLISHVRAVSEVQTLLGETTGWTFRSYSLNPELQCVAGLARASLAHEDCTLFAREFSSSSFG